MSDTIKPSARWVDAKRIPAVFSVSAIEIKRAFDDGAPIRRRYWGRKPLYNADDIDAYIEALDEDRAAV